MRTFPLSRRFHMNHYSSNIREAVLEDAAEITEVHVQSWKESYKGIVEQDYLDCISFAERLKQRKNILSGHSDKGKNLIVFNHRNQIIGFCDIGIARDERFMGCGEIYAIYILKGYQREGIGTALWKQSVNYFKTRNLIPFYVLVLEQNWSARMFYEKHRGTIAHVEAITLGNHSYKEICYCFKECV
ncbi:MAG: hypothetical protein C5B47_01550 [Verrucomicrobia bacterium]|nr:MAG: hypothetical protein C5B47_01550 [Verrucomicrobiota bacterium]